MAYGDGSTGLYFVFGRECLGLVSGARLGDGTEIEGTTGFF